MRLAIVIATVATVFLIGDRTDLAPAVALASQAPAATTKDTRLRVPVEYYKLPNGLKVVLSRDMTTPTAVVAVYYNIGFRNEPKDRTGFAHLFEHMMFQGSANLGKMAFIRLVESNGGLLNGSTRFDFTNYFQVVPAHVLEPVLWAEADRMRSLDIDIENLKNQQEVVKNEVKVNVLNQPYGGFPWIDVPMTANENWYNAHNFYGDLAHLDAATVDDVRTFFKTFYAPNNAALVVTGDFAPEQVKTWIEQYFGNVPSARLPEAPDLKEPRQDKEKRASRSDPLANRPALGIGYHVPDRFTPEWFAFGLLDEALAQGSDSLFYDELVRKKGMTGSVNAGINFGLGSMFDYSGPMLWLAQFFHDSSVTSDSLLSAIDAIVARVRKDGLDQSTLDRARVKMRSGLFADLEQSAGFGRANLLASFALFDDDPSKINQLEDGFEKVTPALVQKTADEFLRPGNRTVYVITPGKSGAPGEREVRFGLVPQQSAQQKPPSAGTPKDFVLPAARRFILANGLPVTMVPFGQVPKVAIRLVVAAGNVYEEKDEVWLADLTGNLMREGTTTQTADVVAQAFATMGGELGISVGPDTTSISTEVLSERAVDAVRLLADVAERPRLPESDLERVKGNLLRNLAIQKSSPQAIAQERFSKLLYGEHPYGRVFPTEAALKGYTLEQVRAFQKNHYGPARARLYVAGVFDAPALEAAIKQSFEGWTGAKAGEPPAVPVPAGRRFALIDRADAPQSTVIVGLRVPTASHKDWVAIEVTDALLGGAFASRITTNIRELKGYTYSPFSTLDPHPAQASWTETADVTTNVTGASLKEIFFEIDRLRKEAPSAAELQGMKNNLAGYFVVQNASRAGVISRLNFADTHRLGPDYLSSYVKRVMAVTPEDVRRIANEYLTPDRMALVVVGDEKTIKSQVTQWAQ